MEISVIIPHVEALIFASEKPVTTLDLLELVNNAIAFMEERATLDQVESAIEAVREKYSSEFYPFEVRESGGGWQFLTKGTYHKTVAVLNGDKFLKRLSSAALETLAIIAYKQPITKGEIESIRGVNSDYAVQKLLEKELVVITGRKEDAPGHPLIYATSKTFMDYFGINSPEELPKLSDIVPTDMVMPTAVGEAHMVDSDVEAEQSDATAPAEHATDENSGEVNMLAVNADGEMEEIMLNAEATIDAAEAIEEVQEETTEIETAEEAVENDDTAADAPDEDAAAPADDEPTQA
ncbi:SMC-Scp complex subunit ScpB [Phnomibacter ginsenosidimutans]|uniref:SMC-Scp complex subunit ScpB n=1 Tax=Phnomibacter ginsenosidimutans TaxID=2676868 RepID=A0A6I6GRG3_9BACT|nr:SMC-Scp complex subunit ScpB [Phnomibacter ginsenosidimutans]QGW27669.1 SMC-Scp complex subunit ScpB [Phnomibacter ginsenosidimutans]